MRRLLANICLRDETIGNIRLAVISFSKDCPAPQSCILHALPTFANKPLLESGNNATMATSIGYCQAIWSSKLKRTSDNDKPACLEIVSAEEALCQRHTQPTAREIKRGHR